MLILSLKHSAFTWNDDTSMMPCRSPADANAVGIWGMPDTIHSSAQRGKHSTGRDARGGRLVRPVRCPANAADHPAGRRVTGDGQV